MQWALLLDVLRDFARVATGQIASFQILLPVKWFPDAPKPEKIPERSTELAEVSSPIKLMAGCARGALRQRLRKSQQLGYFL